MIFFNIADGVGIVSQRMAGVLELHPCVGVLLRRGLGEECRTKYQKEGTKNPRQTDLSEKTQFVSPLRLHVNATALGREKPR